MPTKQELIDDPNSAWNQALDDEDLFILRGTDALSVYTLRRYARYGRREGMPHDMYSEIQAIARRMEKDPRRRLPFNIGR